MMVQVNVAGGAVKPGGGHRPAKGIRPYLEQRMCSCSPVRIASCLPRACAVLLLSLAFWLIPSINPAAAGLDSCWETVKKTAELSQDFIDASEKYIKNKECIPHYGNELFWAVTAALAAAREANVFDCMQVTDQVVAGFLANAPLPIDEDTRSQLQAIASGQSNKAIKDIPLLNFYACACDLSTAPDDVRKLIKHASAAAESGEDCLKALGEIPGILVGGLQALLPVLGPLDCVLGDCSDPPPPEVLYADYLDHHLVGICHDPNISDDQVNDLASQSAANDAYWNGWQYLGDVDKLKAFIEKAQQDFAEKCFQERCKAREEVKRLVCEGTGGQWWQGAGGVCGKGGLLGQCVCAGKWHGTWCEPIPCPMPYTPIVK